MKRFITIFAALAALTLAGCATNYGEYAQAQQAIVKAQSDAETARLLALARIAENGDPASKVGAVVALAVSGQRGTVQMQAPQNQALEWARVLVPAVTQGYMGYLAAGTQRLSIETEGAKYGVTMDALTGVAGKGIDAAAKPPVIIGPDVGFQTLYPVAAD